MATKKEKPLVKAFVPLTDEEKRYLEDKDSLLSQVCDFISTIFTNCEFKCVKEKHNDPKLEFRVSLGGDDDTPLINKKQKKIVK